MGALSRFDLQQAVVSSYSTVHGRFISLWPGHESTVGENAKSKAKTIGARTAFALPRFIVGRVRS